MAFTMKAAGIPVGQYGAKFTRWETSTHAEYGERAQFVWTVLDGQYAGSETSRFTSTKMSPKSALFKIAKGLSGRGFEVGDTFDPDSYVGREYLILVGETESGSTRVETVMAAEAPARHGY